MYGALSNSLKSQADAQDGQDSPPHVGNKVIVVVVGNVATVQGSASVELTSLV
jgi:hypothetical protein